MDRSPFRANFRGMSGTPGFAAAWRRRRGGDGGVGFALRLVCGFVGTLAVIALVSYAVIDRNAQSSQIEQYAKGQRSDVRIFESIGRRSATSGAAFVKIGEVLKVLGERPGTMEATVLDDRGDIVASGNPAEIGTHDAEPRIAGVIASGHAYAGHEGDPRLDARDFEFIAPVGIHSGRYAYELTYDHAPLEAAPAARRH